MNNEFQARGVGMSNAAEEQKKLWGVPPHDTPPPQQALMNYLD